MTASAVGAVAPPSTPGPARSIRIRDVEIGAGRTRTIVSLIESTPDAVLSRARLLGSMREVDVVEYRLDFLDRALDPQAVAATIRPVAEAIKGKPLVVTFRTKAEGGQKAITPEEYAAVYRAVLDGGAADLLDVEAALLAHPVVAQVKADAQAKGCRVILSHHDFAATPSVEMLVGLLRRQQALGADICKVAVMPHDAGDLLRLLEATWIMRRDHADRPLVTMAMGGIGAVSRLAGEAFGSALSFGALGDPSAPGQIEVARLHATLAIVHDAIAG
ncbi:type I 3-dehydroquinate dehydratase [Novosphingobium resinovorum]|uniref:type I 3-dehydroquinate dehydratase n=1 Tax=Novosphingobium resinovorum TaxID=158500 RepID=UPI002ECFE8D4|nr:type I 3-dehydroquinate dehydratase [Novosphingobium resinovorum]